MTLKYHAEHTWVRIESGQAFVGITEHAQEELGEIVYVDLPEPGDRLEAGREFGQIESTKTTSSLIAPISGEVIESNSNLEDSPDLINNSPEKDGWITKIVPRDLGEFDSLMDKAGYDAFLKA